MQLYGRGWKHAKSLVLRVTHTSGGLAGPENVLKARRSRGCTRLHMMRWEWRFSRARFSLDLFSNTPSHFF